ncbi:MAG: hypothetical protein RSD49_06810 [Hafnia sp.]
MYITKIEEVRQYLKLRVTTLTDGHPLKVNVHTYTIGRRAICGNHIVEHDSAQTDNYSSIEPHVNLTQEWMDSKERVIEFGIPLSLHSDTPRQLEERNLAAYLRQLHQKRAFHPSKYFKFDIDGYEQTSPGFRFSEAHLLPKVEPGFLENGAYYVNEKYDHQPVALKLAQFLEPPVLQLINGKILVITHISERGELVYDIDGLRTVDKKLLTQSCYCELLNSASRYKMANTLDDELVGDVAHYRAEFLEKHQATLLGK